MTKLKNGGIYEMWPNASSPEAQAYSYALQKAVELVTKYADNSRCYCMIDTLPEEVVDYLAVEMRSMYYDQALTLKQKREIVKGTLRWYTHAGTVSAVEEMVDIVLGGSGVVEWFDFEDPPYTPGTFDIRTDTKMTEDLWQTVETVIKKVKNVRSHLRKVIVERDPRATAYIGAAALTSGMVSITNRQEGTYAPSETAYAGAAAFSRGQLSITQTGAKERRAGAAMYAAAHAESYSCVYIKRAQASS